VAFVGLAFSHTFALTLVLAVIVGTAQIAFSPASRSALPALAGEELDQAMGTLVFLGSFAMLAGPAIGAAVLLVRSTQTLFLLNAVSFGISSIVLGRLPLDGPPAGTTAADPGALRASTADHSVRGGLRAIRTVPKLSLVVVVGVVSTLSFAMINLAEPLLALGPLSAGAAGFALLVAMFGIGSTIGAARGRANTRQLVVGLFGAAVALALTAVAPSLATAAVTFAINGYFGGLLISSEQRLVATLTPPQFQGRVYGFKNSLESAAFIVAYLLGAVLAVLAGPRWIFAASAITAAMLGAAVLAYQRRA
jgi:MFS family permease